MAKRIHLVHRIGNTKIVKNTFEGYYIKVSDNEKAVAVIVEATSGTQIITSSGSFRGLDVKLTYDIKVNGLTPIKYDAMGPFKYFPFMECRHSVQSMNHRATGKITIRPKNGQTQTFDFTNGHGYIEGDRGHSFPTRYFWTQCNVWEYPCHSVTSAERTHSEESQGRDRQPLSIMATCARIPYLGLKFWGAICIIHYSGKEYRLASYLGARIKQFDRDKIVVTQGLGKRRKTLTVTILDPNKNIHALQAPIKGRFTRTIYESVFTAVRYKFTIGETTLFDVTSNAAAYEYSSI